MYQVVKGAIIGAVASFRANVLVHFGSFASMPSENTREDIHEKKDRR